MHVPVPYVTKLPPALQRRNRIRLQICNPVQSFQDLLNNYVANMVVHSYLQINCIFQRLAEIPHQEDKQLHGHNLVFNIISLAMDFDQCKRSSLPPPCSYVPFHCPLRDRGRDRCIDFTLVGTGALCLSLLCSIVCSLCFLAYPQFSAYYARFYACYGSYALC